MMTITLSRLAESDLKSIARYTEEQWGARQAEAYVFALRQTIREIAQDRLHPVKITAGALKLERVLSGRHHIYMQRSSRNMFISRVLHGAMNLQTQKLPRMPERLK